jgi:hypothetical protein
VSTFTSAYFAAYSHPDARSYDSSDCKNANFVIRSSSITNELQSCSTAVTRIIHGHVQPTIDVYKYLKLLYLGLCKLPWCGANTQLCLSRKSPKLCSYVDSWVSINFHPDAGSYGSSDRKNACFVITSVSNTWPYGPYG